MFADYEPTGRIVSCCGSDIQCIEYTQGGSEYNVLYDTIENTFTRMGKHVKGDINHVQNESNIFSSDSLAIDHIQNEEYLFSSDPLEFSV